MIDAYQWRSVEEKEQASLSLVSVRKARMTFY